MIKFILAAVLLSCSLSASAFSLYDYNGRCGNTRVVLGPTYGKWATANVFANTIMIDPVTPRTFSPLAVEFIFFHECGHMTYGHVPAAAYNTTKPHDEDVADCYAADRFTFAYGRKRLQHTLKEMEHINGKTRNHNILQCK